MASLGTQAGRWFTLSEEEAAMVAEVLARDDDAFEGEETRTGRPCGGWAKARGRGGGPERGKAGGD